MTEIVILDHTLDQAVAIAKYLKKYGNHKVTGCIIGKQTGIFNKLDNYKYFDNIIYNDINQNLLEKYPVVIPVGASSTKQYFDFADCCRLGEVNFKKENLLVSDKVYMLNLCKKLNIPIPKTYIEGEQIENYPVFCKSKYEFSNLPKIRKIARKQSDIDNLPHNEVIIQEFIKHPSTFGVGFIAKAGKIDACFMHEELVSYPKQGGSGVLLKKIYNEQLFNYTNNLLTELNYNGWGLAEFKFVPERNEYVFMEINAKFWASLEFALSGNSRFGKLLFGLNYSSKMGIWFTFIHRLLITNIFMIFRYLPKIIISRKSKSGSFLKVIAVFLNHWAEKL